MVWLFTIVGVVVLFGCNYLNYKKENTKIKDFFINKIFRETLAELIIVVLGVTIAINFTDILEKKEAKEKLITLLEVSKTEIENTYNFNEYFISEYDKSNISISELKYNSKFNVSTLDNILGNDMVIVTLTPLSYSVFCNNIDIAKDFYTLISEANKDDEYISMYVKALNSHLETILFEIDNEISYLDGKKSEEDINANYQKYFSSKYIPITE